MAITRLIDYSVTTECDIMINLLIEITYTQTATQTRRHAYTQTDKLLHRRNDHLNSVLFIYLFISILITVMCPGVLFAFVFVLFDYFIHIDDGKLLKNKIK